MKYETSFDSPAKINLFLQVYPKRNSSDRFHNLISLFLALDFCDRIKLQVREIPKEKKKNLIILELSPESKFFVPTDQRNLIYQATEKYLANLKENNLYKNRFFEIRVILNKQIPVAAGLAGGSINAASTLKYLNRSFQEVLSPLNLQKIASSLGSDVPFGLNLGFALGLNRGELVKTIALEKSLVSDLENYFFVLIIPPEKEKLRTSLVYQYFEKLSKKNFEFKIPEKERLNIKKLEKNLLKFENLFFNSLEQPALELSEWLKKTKKQIQELGYKSLVSGSGPSLFSWFKNYEEAIRFQEQLFNLLEEKIETKVCRLKKKLEKI